MTSNRSWKDRFTKDQLERKRATDRAAHRKTRQRSKQTTAELEHRLQLALQGDHGTLVNHLLDQNAQLQARVEFYQSRLEAIVQAGQDCLDGDGASFPPPKSASRHSHPGSDGQDILSPRLSPRILALQFVFPTDSLFYEIFSFSPLTIPADCSSNLPAADVINSVMNWKLFNQRGKTGFEFLIQNLCLTSSSPCLSLDDIENAVNSDSAFQDVIDRLLFDGPEFGKKSKDIRTSSNPVAPSLSEMERLRRAAAICACENTRQWRDIFKSKTECVAMFWAQYRYFLFLTFPTMENYTKCLPWHRPCLTQFTSSHPGFIDFLIWPKLREHLAQNWQNYSAQELVMSHNQNFEIRGPVPRDRSLIRLKPDMSDIELDESFEEVIRNINNLATNDNFFRQFPDLKSMVNADAYIHKVSHGSNLLAEGMPLTPLTSTEGNVTSRPMKRRLGANLDGELSVPTKRPNVSGEASVASPGLDQCLYPLETVFGNRELAAMACIANMEFSDLPEYNAEIIAMGLDDQNHMAQGSGAEESAD